MPRRIWDQITETADAASIGAAFLLVDKADTTEERREKFLSAMAKLAHKTESKILDDANNFVLRLAARPGVLEGVLDEFFAK